VFAFPLFSGKIGRHKLFYGAATIEVIGALIFAFAGKSLALVLLGAELFFIPQPIIFLVVLMTITDSVEYGQLKLGHRDESLTLSIRPLLDKFGGAVANGVVGMATVAAGMTGGATAATITAHGVSVFKIYMFLIPIALIIVGIIIFAIKVKLDESSHAKIVAELEQTWGKQFKGGEAAADTAIEEPAPQPQPGETDIPAP